MGSSLVIMPLEQLPILIENEVKNPLAQCLFKMFRCGDTNLEDKSTFDKKHLKTIAEKKPSPSCQRNVLANGWCQYFNNIGSSQED